MKHVTETNWKIEDLDEFAWTLLANVSGGDWEKQCPDWQKAVKEWRALYFRKIEYSQKNKK